MPSMGVFDIQLSTYTRLMRLTTCIFEIEIDCCFAFTMCLYFFVPSSISWESASKSKEGVVFGVINFPIHLNLSFFVQIKSDIRMKQGLGRIPITYYSVLTWAHFSALLRGSTGQKRAALLRPWGNQKNFALDFESRTIMLWKALCKFKHIYFVS